MQTNNNQSIYASLENQVPTPTDPLYAIVEPTSVVNSDNQPSSTTVRTSRSRKNKISKRKQVKNACINCQKACKKCDEGRACQRCVKLGIADTCVDSPRKERLKGVKRGPYKKRQRQNDEFSQIIANGQEIPFKYEQPMIWENTTAVMHRQQKQQQSQPQPQPQTHYQQRQHQRQVSTSSSSDLMLGHEQLSTEYYSPPISQQYQYQQSSIHGTPSPLMNSFGDYHQHNNSPVSSSLSTSPASSTVLLPQDTLQSILTLDDMIPLNVNNVPLNQDVLYTGNYSMMMPLQPQHDTPYSPTSSSFAWSACTPSPTTISFAYQSPAQSQPTQCQSYQQYDHQLPLEQTQIKQEQVLYWEPSSVPAYDLSLSYAPTQIYM